MTTKTPINAGVPIVFADSETDSLDPRTRQPWDIALIRREPDGTETEHQFFVELDLSKSDPFALKVGKFWQRHPLGRHYSGEAAHLDLALDNGAGTVPKRGIEWSKACGFAHPRGQYLTRRAAAQRIALVTHGAHIVGAIPSFDTITMEPLLWEAGLMGTWHHHIIDVEALAVGYLRGRASLDQNGGSTDPRVRTLAPPWKSDDLHYLLGLAPLAEEDRHTALGDARWARSFYDKIMAEPARADEAARAEGACA
jgi:hypothetical protein